LISTRLCEIVKFWAQDPHEDETEYKIKVDRTLCVSGVISLLCKALNKASDENNAIEKVVSKEEFLMTHEIIYRSD